MRLPYPQQVVCICELKLRKDFSSTQQFLHGEYGYLFLGLCILCEGTVKLTSVGEEKLYGTEREITLALMHKAWAV